jgi:colicin import membrane protein
VSATIAQGLPFPPRREPAFTRSFVLAAIVHGVLIGIMFLGVRMQSSPPEVVTVELWETAPPQPAPVVEPPAPPPPAPKEEAPPPPPKPDIVVREKPKPKPKPEPKRDRDFERRLREQVALEQKALDQERRATEERRREREAREAAQRQAAAARNRALAEWTDRIKIKIRGRIPVSAAEAVPGNPEAVFEVRLLPTGEVLGEPRMKQSSGNAPYDEAVKRAILSASPLPLPTDRNLFQSQLELRFRPKDQQRD